MMVRYSDGIGRRAQIVSVIRSKIAKNPIKQSCVLDAVQVRILPVPHPKGVSKLSLTV